MAIQPSTKPRSSFKNVRRWEPMHTGGHADLSADGGLLCSTIDDVVAVTNVETGERVTSLPGDSSAVTCLACTCSPDYSALLTAHRSLSLRFYLLSGQGAELLKVVARAHDSPIAVARADPTSSLFATGDVGGVVKVWDARQGHCTHVFRGHGGAITALSFDVQQPASSGAARARLLVGSSDGRARVWDLMHRGLAGVLEGHSSAVTGVAATSDGSIIVTGSRDKMVNVWDFRSSSTGRLVLSIPTYETIESIGIVPSTDDPQEPAADSAVFTAGELGYLRLWSIKNGRILRSQASRPHNVGITSARLHAQTILVAEADHNLSVVALPTLVIARQFVGHNDEIVDLCLLPRSFEGSSDLSGGDLAVATNSPVVRLYDMDRHDVRLIRGHTDIVLCLAGDRSGSFLVTGSKDRTARVWRRGPRAQSPDFLPSGLCEGHVGGIGAIALGRTSPSILATASEDRTVKLWDLASVPAGEAAEGATHSFRSLLTLKIHDKDINALDIAPNDRLLASGSQDKLGKIFELAFSPGSAKRPATASLRHVGTLKGHARGIWSVRFSSHDRCIATGSGDRTIKLWSLTDYSCIKTFEGHTNSVLRLDFITRGTQLVSAASDGLVKVWNISADDCSATLDGHDEKVWALAVDDDGARIVSGGADSRMNVWEDVTEREEEDGRREQQRQILRAQDYDNFLALRDYRNAIVLALAMDNPARLLTLFRQVARARPTSGIPASDSESITGLAAVDEVIRTLPPHDLAALLRHVRTWNALAKTADVAQTVLHAIFRLHSADVLLAPSDRDGGQSTALKQEDVGTVLDSLLPFTERHLLRSQRTAQEASMLKHVLSQMSEV